jgi:hypothetical protein
MSLDSMTMMISIDEFAARHNVATRTVRRWLDADRIPGAVKVAGKWSLPADAAVQDPAAAAAPTSLATVTSGHVKDMATVQQPTVAGMLAQLPAMLPLDVAARVLGISEYAIRRNAEYFQLLRAGAHGSYVMPKARVRELDGRA